MKLILHPATRRSIDNFLSNPSHAVLIHGSRGSGKGAVGRQLLTELLNNDRPLEDQPFVSLLDAGTDPSIDSVRTMQRFMQLKTPGEQAFRRAILLEHADSLTTEAQNAFLKLLEEPPADTIIILTADNSRQLLPTIRSRTQQIVLNSPDLEAVLDGLQDNYEKTAIGRAYQISGGSMALLQAVLSGQTDQPLLTGIDQVKRLLAMSQYERLCQLDDLAKDKAGLPVLLEALRRVSQAALVSAASQNKPTVVRRWQSALAASLAAEEQLERNVSPKLLLTNLLLNL